MIPTVIYLLLLIRILHALPLNSPLLDTYDYIVVGGGASGLTTANRLSEDPTVSVLVLEAGPSDNAEPWIQIPFFAGQGVGSTYDWNLMTVPQTYLDGKARAMPQGRVLGGGTVLNAMLWNRGGIGDYDDWVTLGNPGWGWFDMLPYFIKSETFTPYPSGAIANAVGIGYKPDVHGTKGPVNVSFSNYIYNQTENFFTALGELNIPTALDPNDGTTAGSSFLPIDLNPENQTRCDARVAYYDPYASRPNLWVSTNQHVTRILFEDTAGNTNVSSAIPGEPSVGQGNSSTKPNGLFGSISRTTVGWIPLWRRWLASYTFGLLERWADLQVRQSASTPVTSTGSLLRGLGVEFASTASSPRMSVSVNREIVLAAGALHTPQILKLSGIGPSKELNPLQIPVLVDLPGVGMNLQDHRLVGVYYPYQDKDTLTSITLAANITLMNQYGAEYSAGKTGPWTAGPPDGDAFPALTAIVNSSNNIVKDAQSQIASQYLSMNSDTTLIAGFDSQRQLLIKALRDPTRAAYELLNFNYGAFSNANMRPFSRGTVMLNSSQPFDPPLVDPRYGSNPIDLDVLVASIKFNRQIIATEAMQTLQPLEVSPASNASDEDILGYVKDKIQTEFHPSGTCAMLPLRLGGVVDPRLLVFGTKNLRIVDASIMPMLPASHLQAVVYGVAEKAADIIKSVYNGTAGNFSSGSSGNLPGQASSNSSPSTSSSPSSSSSVMVTQTRWVTMCGGFEL